MTKRKPKPESLADIAGRAIKEDFEERQLKAEIEKHKAAIEEFLASPKGSEHVKAIVRVAIHRPVSFELAVKTLAESPLMRGLQSAGSDIMVEAGPDQMGFRVLPLLEIEELLRPETRETAPMSRAIAAARTDPDAFDALKDLAFDDLKREGMPNWALRQWLASDPQRPKGRKRRKAKMDLRDAALAHLIDSARILGFAPTKNDASQSKRSGCEVVSEALRVAGLPSPGIPALKDIWRRRKDVRPWGWTF